MSSDDPRPITSLDNDVLSILCTRHRDTPWAVNEIHVGASRTGVLGSLRRLEENGLAAEVFMGWIATLTGFEHLGLDPLPETT